MRNFGLDYSSIESALSITNSEEEKNERNQLYLSSGDVEEYEKRTWRYLYISQEKNSHSESKEKEITKRIFLRIDGCNAGSARREREKEKKNLANQELYLYKL